MFELPGGKALSLETKVLHSILKGRNFPNKKTQGSRNFPSEMKE